MITAWKVGACTHLPLRALLLPSAESFLPNKKKGGKGEEDEGKGIVHDDVWCLDLKSLEFERIKRQGGWCAGVGQSAGCTQVPHKGGCRCSQPWCRA